MKITFLMAAVCSGLFLASCTSDSVYVAGSGKTPPPLLIANQYGRPVNLQQATSGPWTAVFFYPKASTRG